MAYLYFSAVVLISFFLTAFLYVKTVELPLKIFPKFDAEKLIFIVPILLFIPQLFLFRYFGNFAKDALFYPQDYYILAVGGCSFLIGVWSFSEKMKNFSLLSLAASCSFCAYLLPDDILFYGITPEALYLKSAIATSWFFIALGCFFFSKQDGLLSEFIILFSVILVILYALSGISFAQLLSVAGFLGIAGGYLVYNWKPAQMKMNIPAALSFGFLFGFVLLGCSVEGMWLSVQIVAAYLYVAIIMYFLQKISFIDGYEANKSEIGFCAQAMLILAVIAVIQIYTATTKSIFIVGIMFLLWLRGKYFFRKQSFKEVNKQVVKNIKNEMNNLRNFLDKK